MVDVKKPPVEREELLQDTKKVMDLLAETLAMNEVWLSTGISATGTLLMHLLLDAGLKAEALKELQKALNHCAESLGAKSVLISGKKPQKQ
jgi:hypothetical protein